MKQLILVMVLFIGMMNVSIAQQEQMVSVPVSQLTEQQKTLINQQQEIKEVSGWIGLGNEIGQAFNGALSALTDNATKLADSKLGKFAMFIVAFKIVGIPIIGMIFLFIQFIVITIIFYIYLKHNCLNYKTIENEEFDSNGKLLKREYYIKNRDSDASMAIWSSIIYIITQIGIIGVILGNIN